MPCTHSRWQYEGSWGRDGAFYVRRCADCRLRESVSKDHFFDAMLASTKRAEAGSA